MSSPSTIAPIHPAPIPLHPSNTLDPLPENSHPLADLPTPTSPPAPSDFPPTSSPNSEYPDPHPPHPDFSKRQLSFKQLHALDLLYRGTSDRKTARLVGVDPKTLRRWRLFDPVFESRLNRIRKSLLAESVDGLRALAPAALAHLKRNLKSGTPAEKTRIAIQILKISGLSRLTPRVGPDNTLDILVTRELHHRCLAGNDPEIEKQIPASQRDLDNLHQFLLDHIAHDPAEDAPPTLPPTSPNPSPTPPTIPPP